MLLLVFDMCWSRASIASMPRWSARVENMRRMTTTARSVLSSSSSSSRRVLERPDVDGGEDAAFGKFAVEQQFHVAGALEFFVDHVIHAAAGIDQGCGDDGQAATLFDFTRCAKEAFGREKRAGVKTAGERAAAGLHGQVIGAAQARDAIEQDYHVAPAFHESLGAFQHHLGHASMRLGWLIKCGTDDFGLDRAFHVGDFFWSLTDQGDHQVGIGVVFGDRVGDGLEEHGFAGFRRRDDQAALSATDGCHQVNNAPGDIRRNRFQVEHLAWENGCQEIEMRATFGDFRVHAVNGFYAQQAIVLFVILRWTNLAGNHISCAQAEAANLRLRDVDIHIAGQETLLSEETEPVFNDFQHACAENVALLFGMGLEKPENEVLFFEGSVTGEFEVASDVA